MQLFLHKTRKIDFVFEEIDDNSSKTMNMKRIIVETVKDWNHKNHNEQGRQFVAHKWKTDGDFASGDPTFVFA